MLREASGVSLVMVINSCNVADAIDKSMTAAGLSNVSYSNSTCASDEEIKAKIPNISVLSKVMAENTVNF